MLILFIILILFFLFLNEFFSRKYSISSYFSRKIAHVASSLIALIMSFFLTKNEIILIGIIFAVLLFLTRRKNIFSSIHSVERKTFGEVFLPMGVILCALFFVPQNIIAFQFGILIMGISDALASIFGERFGRHIIKIFGHKKSFEGSAVFLASSIIITLFFVNKLDYSVLFIPIILTSIELFLIFGLDNLVLPLAGAYLFQFLP